MISVFPIRFLEPMTSKAWQTLPNRAHPAWTPQRPRMWSALFIHSADFGAFMRVQLAQSCLYCSSAVYFDLIYNNYYSSGPS